MESETEQPKPLSRANTAPQDAFVTIGSRIARTFGGHDITPLFVQQIQRLTRIISVQQIELLASTQYSQVVVGVANPRLVQSHHWAAVIRTRGSSGLGLLGVDHDFKKSRTEGPCYLVLSVSPFLFRVYK